MSKFSKKNALISILPLLPLLLILYVIFYTGEVNLLGTRFEKSLELKQAEIIGWKDGGKHWEFKAQSGWTDRNQTFTELDNVIEGKIFRKNKIIVKNIRASMIREYKERNLIVAAGKSEKENSPVTQQLEADLNLKGIIKEGPRGQVSKSGLSGFTRIWSDRLEYSRAEEKTTASGNIKIREGSQILLASKLEVDHKQEIAYIKERPSLKTRELIISGDSMENFYGREEKVLVNQKVEIFIQNKNPKLPGTSLNCQQVEYFKKTGNARLEGDLKILQKGKVIFARRGDYNSQARTLQVNGQVRVVLYTEKETQLNCEQLAIHIDTKDVRTSGSTEVSQPGKTTLAPQATYTAAENKIVLQTGVKTVLEKGKVILKETAVKALQNPEAKEAAEERTVLTSDVLAISTLTGDIQATGSVEVFQNLRHGKSQTAVYDDRRELISLEKDVYVEKKGNWIKTEKIIVSVRDETFTAIGGVETKFELKN